MTWLLATPLHATGQESWDIGMLLKSASRPDIHSDALFLEYAIEW